MLKLLLAAGGDISKPLTSGPNQGASAVWAAAFKGRSECLPQLLAAGCDVNACSDDGRSPVDVATANGHKEMVEDLLLAGATPSSVAVAAVSANRGGIGGYRRFKCQPIASLY